MPRLGSFSGRILHQQGVARALTVTPSTTVIEQVSSTSKVLPTGMTNSTTVKKFGSTSLYCNGSSTAYVEFLSNSVLQGTTGPATITYEMWFYQTVQSANTPFLVSSGTGTTGQAFFIAGLQVRFTETTGVASSSIPLTLGANTWHHVAFVTSTTSYSTYINGLYVSTASGTYANLGAGSDYRQTVDKKYVTIGGWTRYTNSMFTGYVDDIRISNIARYTGTTTYTVPTSRPSVDANTLLLIYSS